MELIVSGIRTPDFMKRQFKTNCRLTAGLYLVKGGNGIGKSVFMNTLIGFYGEAPLITRQDESKATISYFNQDSYAATDSVYWNLFLDKRSEQVAAQRDAQAKQLLSNFGMTQVVRDLDAELNPTLLSGGQLKKIGLIRALLRQADLYLLDEPTNDLDRQSVQTLVTLMDEVARSACVVAITHDRTLEILPHRDLDLFHD